MHTRFAPSPTGEDIHVGNLRIAVINHHLAKSTGGQFILRVEDTLNDRLVEGCTDNIIQNLEIMGMKPDRIYTQSSRKDLYMAACERLLYRGYAYKKDGAVWVKGGEGGYKDLIMGDMHGSFDDFVIVRSNGEPSFIFANAYDDGCLRVELGEEFVVIRGNDHIDNTYKQLRLFELLGMEPVSYASVSMVVDKDKKPLSKRDKAGTVGKLLDMGVAPKCLYKYLLEMGHGERIDTIMKAPVCMDLNKLLHMNREYLTIDIVGEKCPAAVKYYDIVKKHIRCTEELGMFAYLWERPEKKSIPQYNVLLDWREGVQAAIDKWLSIMGLSKKEGYSLLRDALCGSPYSLDIALVMESIGIDECFVRLE